MRGREASERSPNLLRSKQTPTLGLQINARAGATPSAASGWEALFHLEQQAEMTRNWILEWILQMKNQIREKTIVVDIKHLRWWTDPGQGIIYARNERNAGEGAQGRLDSQTQSQKKQENQVCTAFIDGLWDILSRLYRAFHLTFSVKCFYTKYEVISEVTLRPISHLAEETGEENNNRLAS